MSTTNIQPFAKELDFEKALTDLLLQNGWNEVIMNPTEEDLIKNWANIIFDNNRDITKLNNAPLTNTEMQQILSKVNLCSSPYDMNKFINGQEVSIKRDNHDDHNNYGKVVYLKIFDPKEICAGQSRYQIVRQPRFKTALPLAGDRRGDIMLLINGMPVIHVELKRSGIDVSQAAFQLKRYTHEGVFSSGMFKMVQIFVAMTPEETLYFANPGTEDRFQSSFYFHWEDFNNTIIHDWKKVATDLLSIPMAHQLIGYYTIADDKDKTLKVLRSYQYYAASKISDVVRETNWDDHQHRGGYIWHTTGSGKTMTSFKSAQLIASSGDADKVVFLLDRIELSLQSLDEYRGFADDPDSIQDPHDSVMLMSKLKSTDKDDRLIVTSIQKMSRINVANGISQAEIDFVNRKRLVFIIDECHRSVFGDMLIGIKNTFSRSLLFGFTGTPVFEENAHNEITTETIFGDMLHKYTIANAIPDKNVLGFDLYRENTYKDQELREKVALLQTKAKSVDEIKDNEEKMAIYNKFMNDVQMPDIYIENGVKKYGIEHYLPKDTYQKDVHHFAVAEDIVKSRDQLSQNGKFHAILATQNIPEAIAYYKLFKERYSSLHVVSIFDESIDNSDHGIVREDALIEMLTDYNKRYGTSFQLSTYGKYKRDVAKRLAHKKPYIGIENDHNKQIDLLIVVTQMLTGYDSKWVNTLYVDKVMKYVDVIQAFSRTNRIFGPEKPFGIIRYYAFPYTMEQNIKDALEVYVDRPLGVFVDKLETNLQNINSKFQHIRDIFFSHEIFNFEKLPDTREDRNMFAQDFCNMTHLLEAAKLQGFVWEKLENEFQHGDTYTKVTVEFDEPTYMTLLQRYRELFEKRKGTEEDDDFEYPVDTYITETGTGTIDAEYINSNFVKFVKNLYTEGPESELTKRAISKLHKSFASFSQKDQQTAILIIHDIQRGDLRLEVGKTIRDYINEYQLKELHNQILVLSEATGINISMLQKIMSSNVTEKNLDEFGRFEDLKITVNSSKAKIFLEKIKGKSIPSMLVNPMMDSILRKFILNADERTKILKAYINDNVPNATAIVNKMPKPDLEKTEKGGTQLVLDIGKVKSGITSILLTSLSDVLKYMRPVDEILDSVFYVLNTKSIDSLDSVGMYISSALSDLFAKEDATIVNKFVAFNLLVTKFEAYLKKLYYLINKEEVKPQYEGDDVTWKDVIHSFRCLWGLKNNFKASYQQLYQYLILVKGWRNDESHISPTASEKELQVAINTIVTLYFYTSGSCITDLESAGCDIKDHSSKIIFMKSGNYTKKEAFDGNDDIPGGMAAEPINARKLSEQTRIDILRNSIVKLINYGYTKKESVFTKQRHWIAIYRIAADYGFVIDGDYPYFNKIIGEIKLENLPATLTRDFIEKNNKGIYASSFEDWTNEGLTGKQLNEYEDIKHCAEVFRNIVTENIKKQKNYQE
jgi:type I restriction enzyme R subunit